MGGAHHVVGIVREDRAFLPADGREDVVGAGQAGRVRAGRLHPGVGASGLHDEHRLAGLPRRGERRAEARSVEQPLEVHADRLGARLVDHVLDEVADLEIGLVAERDAVAEAEAVGAGAVEDRDHQGAALADETDRPVVQPLGVEHDRRAERQPVVRHDQSHAVRPDEPDAGAPRDLHELGLTGGAVGAGLGEAGGDDDAAADAGLGRLAHALDERGRWHRENRDVGRRRHRGDRRVGAASEHLGAAQIDRVDVAAEAVAHQEPHDAPAELVAAVRGAEDGDRAWMQDARDVEPRPRAVGEQRGVQERHRSRTIPPGPLDGSAIAVSRPRRRAST